MFTLRKVFLFFVLFTTLTGLLNAHTRELQMKIMDYGSPLSATVYLYQVTDESTGNLKLTLYRSGTSAGGSTWKWTNPECNLICDIDDSNTSDATWSPITYGRYYIRIGSSFCDVYINYYDGSSGDADFVINYQNGEFSNDESKNNRGITFYGSYTWSANFSITAKNSFGGGDIKFDGTRYNSIPAAGKTFPIIATNNPLEARTFPHYVEAIDDGSQVSGGFVQSFENFGGLSGSDNLNVRTISTPSSGTVTANFKDRLNVIFQNFYGAGNITVDGQSYSSPTGVLYVKRDYSKSATAQNYVSSGMQYIFSQWKDDLNRTYSGQSYSFFPDGHRTYTAYFLIEKPVFTNRNLTSPSAVGQPITLDWDDHINSSVTYKIYRKVKHNGVTGPEALIGSTNHGTTVFTDLEYTKTSSYVDLVSYDVRAYYPPNGSYSDPNWASVYGESFAKKSDNSGEINTEYSLSNYPNPFNPSTNIEFNLPEDASVRLTIYNVLGEQIKEIINTFIPAGTYSAAWNGDNKYGGKVNSGIYFTVLEANNRRIVTKMILSK